MHIWPPRSEGHRCGGTHPVQKPELRQQLLQLQRLHRPTAWKDRAAARGSLRLQRLQMRLQRLQRLRLQMRLQMRLQRLRRLQRQYDAAGASGSKIQVQIQVQAPASQSRQPFSVVVVSGDSISGRISPSLATASGPTGRRRLGACGDRVADGPRSAGHPRGAGVLGCRRHRQFADGPCRQRRFSTHFLRGCISRDIAGSKLFPNHAQMQSSSPKKTAGCSVNSRSLRRNI